jgi:hypothetical protein
LAKQLQKKGADTNNENKNPIITGTTNPKPATKTTHHKPAVKFSTIQTMLEKRALCPNCKFWGRHRPADCLELEANKEKRKETWTPRNNN